LTATMSASRIAFICTAGLDNPSVNGRWLPIARELRSRQLDARLILLHPDFDTLAAAERSGLAGGVPYTYVAQMHVRGLSGRRTYFPPQQLARIAAQAIVAQYRAVLAMAPAIIHICKPQPINGTAGWLAARKLKQPYFVDCDDHEATANRFGSSMQRRVVRWFEDRLPLSAQAITANTRYLANHFAALGMDPGRIHYVPNGIAGAMQDSAALPPGVLALRGAPVVIYVGNMSTLSHGVDLLLAAFKAVLARRPDARLLMVGDGDEKHALETLAAELGIADCITWTGRLPHAQALACYQIAACSVDPVRDQPAMRARSPLKIVESMAAGVPVITGDVGDRREMIGAAGVIVQPDSAAALADGMLQGLDQAAGLAPHARTRSTAFAIARLADDWLMAYGGRI
jgi:glycosyltransferase involved in cell wall biosynthesis